MNKHFTNRNQPKDRKLIFTGAVGLGKNMMIRKPKSRLTKEEVNKQVGWIGE